MRAYEPAGRNLMTTLFQDVRYGLRLLWKSPVFTIVAVLSLALGVGANTAIFSIVNAVLLRSLPFSHPDRLVKIVANNRGVGAQDIGLSVPELDDLRTRAGVFDQVTAIQGGPTNLTGAEHPQHLELLEVSPNYFSMLGISAHGKIVRTHLQQFEMLRMLRAGQVCRATLDSSHLVKDARSCSEIVQFGNGESNILCPHPPIVSHDLHQPVRVRKRTRTQQTRVHDAK